MVKRDEVRDCKTCGHLIVKDSSSLVPNGSMFTSDTPTTPWRHLSLGDSKCNLVAQPAEVGDASA